MIQDVDTKLKESINDKEFSFINAEHHYRFERKFTVPNVFSFAEIEHQIKRNSALFREVYQKRQVNNIYFDTAGYNDYFDNVLGISDRKKMRIRWYGDTFGQINKPVLEVKIKKGLVGDKWTYKLKSFMLNNDFMNSYIQKILKESEIPLPILESMKMTMPTLLNSYSRTYYLSADNRYRITLDFDLLYHKIDRRFNNFDKKPEKDKNKIIELKYGLLDDDDAKSISTQFSFRLNKNSKYVNGVDAHKHFPQ
ncbi:MAG: VTC domain-containing protein [Flavobacteriaceae bacterium]